MVRRIIALLNRVDRPGFAGGRCHGTLCQPAPLRWARLVAVLKDVRNLNAEAYRQVRG